MLHVKYKRMHPVQYEASRLTNQLLLYSKLTSKPQRPIMFRCQTEQSRMPAGPRWWLNNTTTTSFTATTQREEQQLSLSHAQPPHRHAVLRKCSSGHKLLLSSVPLSSFKICSASKTLNVIVLDTLQCAIL